ncbi:hypothetical protein AAHC03_09842 [Spirometra sp. Aus1]
MRDLEVDRLFKRFPHDQIKELGGGGDEDESGGSVRNFALLFTPSDPDWVCPLLKHPVKPLICFDFPAQFMRTITASNSVFLITLALRSGAK